MLQTIPGLPEDTVGLSAIGTVTGDDYEQILIPRVTEKMKTHGGVRLLFLCGPEFEGYSPAAVWEDAKFGLAHRADFRRVAVVTDVVWLTHATRLFAPFIPCAVSVFPNNALEAAKRWLAA
jgi:SpoIIAA-like